MNLRFLDGVIPAITTPFNVDDSIDHGFLARHTELLMASGCSGIVAFVQLIKRAQEMVGLGSSRVRAPRLALEGDELAEARALIQHAIDTRPALD